MLGVLEPLGKRLDDLRRRTQRLCFRRARAKQHQRDASALVAVGQCIGRTVVTRPQEAARLEGFNVDRSRRSRGVFDAGHVRSRE
eukprot:3717940-Prymnesium_polylepis.2